MADIHDIESLRRSDLTATVIQLLDTWGLSIPQQIRVLGLPDDIPLRRFAQYRKQRPLPDDDAITLRIHYLLGIHQAISKLYPHNPIAGDYWLTTPNRMFAGKPPLDLMLEQGSAGMRSVLEHLQGGGEWGNLPF